MDRKLIYLFSLLAFFLMWGVFGFAAASPRGERVAGESAPLAAGPAPVSGAERSAELVPVTGEAEERPGGRGVYVLFAFGILIVILVLLNAANRPAVTPSQRKDPPDES